MGILTILKFHRTLLSSTINDISVPGLREQEEATTEMP